MESKCGTIFSFLRMEKHSISIFSSSVLRQGKPLMSIFLRAVENTRWSFSLHSSLTRPHLAMSLLLTGMSADAERRLLWFDGEMIDRLTLIYFDAYRRGMSRSVLI